MLPITCHGGATSNDLHAEAIVHMLTRSDTLVFSGSQTCGILLFRTRTESSFGEQKVKDSDRLELDWLLKCKLEELIASVRRLLRIVSKSSGPFSIALADQVSSGY